MPPTTEDPLNRASIALTKVVTAANLYEAILDDAARCQLRGESPLPCLAPLVKDEPGFVLLNTLRFESLPLSDGTEEAIGKEGMQLLRRFHAKYYPILEKAFDATVDLRLYGIENSWEDSTCTYLYDPEERQLLMKLSFDTGVGSLFASTDRLQDFLSLSTALLNYCRRGLFHARESNLVLSESQQKLIADRVARAQSAMEAMVELVPLPEETSADSGEDSGPTSTASSTDPASPS